MWKKNYPIVWKKMGRDNGSYLCIRDQSVTFFSVLTSVCPRETWTRCSSDISDIFYTRCAAFTGSLKEKFCYFNRKSVFKTVTEHKIFKFVLGSFGCECRMVSYFFGMVFGGGGVSKYSIFNYQWIVKSVKKYQDFLGWSGVEEKVAGFSNLKTQIRIWIFRIILICTELCCRI